MFSNIFITFIFLSASLVLNYGFVVRSEDDDPLTVDIADGTLQGRTITTAAGVTFYSFQGIPYAKSPVGDLRYKAPQPPEPWEGVKDATSPGSDCPQGALLIATIPVGNDDCLFLNVYTSQLPSGEESPNLPVMVWIHGGAFSIGSGAPSIYGPDYLMNNGDFVLVTINYRLGAIGYFGLNHPEVSKNNGMKDQVAALKWVKNNIDKFGGNPDDVTIFGESAGGASVHYHLISPLSQGLFQKAIAQSGSSLDMWAFTDPETAHERAVAVANELKFNTDDPSELLESYINAKASDIVKAQNNIPSVLYLPKLFGATSMFSPTLEDDVEGAFLPDTPINLLKSGNFQKVPYLTGTTSAEGKLFAWGARNDPDLLQQYNDNIEDFVPKDLGLEQGSAESKALANKFKQYYFGNESISEDTLQQLVEFESDFGIVYGVHRAVKLQLVLADTPVYRYVFSYEGRLGISKFLLMSYSFPGAGHGDDLGYFFKFYQFNISLPDDSPEMKMVSQLTKLWTDFAKTGNPTTNSDFDWPPFSEESQTYLNIDTELTVEDWNTFEPENIALWDDAYKDIDALDV